MSETASSSPRDPSRVYIEQNPDGSMILSRGGESASFENPVATIAKNEEQKSAALSRLARLRGESGAPLPSVVRLDLASDAEPWFIKALDLEAVTRVGIYAGRDARGQIALHEEGGFTGLLAALLFVGVCNEDGTPFYTVFGEAFAQACERAASIVEVNADLFTAILKLNPGILPEATSGEKKTKVSAHGSTLGTRQKASLSSRVAGRARASKKKPSTSAPR